MTPASRTVFVSYSHDSTAHEQRVHQLVDRLREEGVDCNLDLYEDAPPEGWPAWMDRHIRESDYVLVVCTEVYERRITGKEKRGIGLGAKWEGSLITQALYNSGGRNEKFIPIVFDSRDVEHIPEFLGRATRYDLSTDEGYERLYRRLTAQPAYPKRPLGKVRQLPPMNVTPPKRAKKRTDQGRASSVEVPPTKPSPKGKPERRRGELVLIARDLKNPEFFTAIVIEVSQAITMVLVTDSGEERAFLEELSRRSHDTVHVAYGLNAVRARVTSVKHVREGGEERYHVTLDPDERDYGGGIMEMSTNGYSADNIAELRARRILLNEPLPGRDAGSQRGRLDGSMLEALVSGLSTPLPVDHSPLPQLYRQLSAVDGNTFLKAARLVAALWLRRSGTVQHVLEIDLRVSKKGELKVHFRGRRRKVYSNQDPVEIRVDGACRLA